MDVAPDDTASSTARATKDTMKKLSILALALGTAFSAASQASVIKVEGASASTPFLASGDAYLAAVDAALSGATYHWASVSSLDAISHGALFGSYAGFAMKTTVNFGVATAGSWMFRAGVDFGYGGAMLLDGVAVDFKGNDMWWEGNYNNASQYFSAASALGAGNHVLTIVGFEGCCDGGQQVQFMRAGSNAFTSFSSADQLDVAAIPEPASISLALLGAGLLGLSRRRKVAAHAA